eukprot:4668465-Pyramimonas_sp.AAC.1
MTARGATTGTDAQPRKNKSDDHQTGRSAGLPRAHGESGSHRDRATPKSQDIANEKSRSQTASP